MSGCRLHEKYAKTKFCYADSFSRILCDQQWINNWRVGLNKAISAIFGGESLLKEINKLRNIVFILTICQNFELSKNLCVYTYVYTKLFHCLNVDESKS